MSIIKLDELKHNAVSEQTKSFISFLTNLAQSGNLSPKDALLKAQEFLSSHTSIRATISYNGKRWQEYVVISERDYFVLGSSGNLTSKLVKLPRKYIVLSITARAGMKDRIKRIAEKVQNYELSNPWQWAYAELYSYYSALILIINCEHERGYFSCVDVMAPTIQQVLKTFQKIGVNIQF